jgi:AbrB family looped-hinge helix DNA binding protein
MEATMTVKGQVTIPKKIRETLHLTPGNRVEFSINPEGQIVVRKAGVQIANETADVQRDCFEAARGKAQVKWRTDDLMIMLRGAD